MLKVVVSLILSVSTLLPATVDIPKRVTPQQRVNLMLTDLPAHDYRLSFSHFINTCNLTFIQGTGTSWQYFLFNTNKPLAGGFSITSFVTSADRPKQPISIFQQKSFDPTAKSLKNETPGKLWTPAHLGDKDIGIILPYSLTQDEQNSIPKSARNEPLKKFVLVFVRYRFYVELDVLGVAGVAQTGAIARLARLMDARIMKLQQTGAQLFPTTHGSSPCTQ